VSLSEEISRVGSLFIDTSIAIYLLEAHPEFGSLAKQVVEAYQSGSVSGYTSVVTVTETIAKPAALGDEAYIQRCLKFLEEDPTLTLVEITPLVAERAGRLRGKYRKLRTADAMQLAAAILAGTEAFVTNDVGLKRVDEIRIIVLRDYLCAPSSRASPLWTRRQHVAPAASPGNSGHCPALPLGARCLSRGYCIPPITHLTNCNASSMMRWRVRRCLGRCLEAWDAHKPCGQELQVPRGGRG